MSCYACTVKIVTMKLYYAETNDRSNRSYSNSFTKSIHNSQITMPGTLVMLFPIALLVPINMDVLQANFYLTQG